eukprot:snap_masked-scaffold_5-processed-gene-16.59-mRNA-1 protein AED:1.00 eAED:1.00 QI:0/0/0/0/1/1/2/0/167
MTKQSKYSEELCSPWKNVVTAYWNMYPSIRNDAVKDCFVVSRSFNSAQQVLKSTRVIYVNQPTPAIYRPLTSSESYFAIEKSVVDFREEKMKITTENVSFDTIAKVKEHCSFTKNAGNTTKFYWFINIDGQIQIPILTNRVENALLSQSHWRMKTALEIINDRLQQE